MTANRSTTFLTSPFFLLFYEAFFREKPDRVISYSAIEELSYLLGVKISKHNQKNLLERFKSKHKEYWRSRRLIQRSMDDWIDDNAVDSLHTELLT